ncbi:uncharacterized protein N7479_000276 [Penicillium vulpinum]|uniref:Uncharacterized protein n=1 Tax=Penicillium vulpinum TaxID=29845 RepID=A0A1V6RMN6_9EURO|nr:uncharacterized protein N7479_000276 [Penicillium vulpinum]KAJ5970358.1 hypothetical protein N7479_000276 [Penicillium vulpinum]OQE03045.1 hypothetical protein PENVUL_c035G07238 [Penicillium vulpinum]
MGDHAQHIAKHVDADLYFRRRPDVDSSVEVDFTKGKPDDNAKKMHVRNETHQVQVRDIRGRESSYTLDKNGFVYVLHEMPELDRVLDEEHVKETTIPQTESLVRKITGATRTVTFVHRVRSLATDTSSIANNRAPAHSVHSDFTTTGALHYLKTVVPDEQERDRLLTGRVLIINVWRPLKTIQKDPLAVCDWSSVNMQDESVPTRLTLPNGWSELGQYAFSPSQRWCYLSGQRPNEPLVFMQFDSSKVDEGGITVPHSAFVDPRYSDCAARESLEIKMFAFV